MQKTTKAPRVLVLGGCDRPIRNAGGVPVELSYTSGDQALEAVKHENIHALLLTGGSDVSPEIYGARRSPHTQKPHESRDLTEMLAVEAAMKRGIPVLGICRGAQMINAVNGGTLHQHVPNLKGAGNYHGYGRHAIRLAKRSRLAKMMGGTRRDCKSLHHQAVDKVAPGFTAVAWADDGIVEAIESVAGWTVGVQFHPELALGLPGSQGIFDAFVAAAAKAAGLPVPVRSKAPAPQPQRRSERPLSETWTRSGRSHFHATREEELDAEMDADADDAFLDGLYEEWQRMERAEQEGATLVVPRLKKNEVRSYFRCFVCRMDFDEKQDRDDHMRFLHA